MTKLKGLLLTEGMHGMISQAEGLAKALGLDFIHEKIELNNFWKLIPPKITPIKRFVFKNDILKKFNVVISCGRKSVIPSIRTPQRIIDKANDFYNGDQIIISDVDKKAYLSSLKLADHIVVTCDSTSMISEAAITGKPIYVADMPAIKNNYRFKKFFELFKSLDIIRNLDSSVESWDYKKLNETDRIAGYIEKRFQNYDFS